MQLGPMPNQGCCQSSSMSIPRAPCSYYQEEHTWYCTVKTAGAMIPYEQCCMLYVSKSTRSMCHWHFDISGRIVPCSVLCLLLDIDTLLYVLATVVLELTEQCEKIDLCDTRSKGSSELAWRRMLMAFFQISPLRLSTVNITKQIQQRSRIEPAWQMKCGLVCQDCASCSWCY